MKFDFIIFGATGLQGRICARDLLESGYSAMLVGRDPSGIKKLLKDKKAKYIQMDLKNNKLIQGAIAKSNAKVVINCAEHVFNVPIMKACLKAKRSCTDLGGLQNITSEQFKLYDAFRRAGIICITGCGSTPGILNVLTALALKEFDTVRDIDLGFAWDSNIKKFIVPYSIKSIFDEFTQAPVTFHNGKFVKENRIVCLGKYKFKEIGEQTVYCIVHSEVYTFAKYFKSKGLQNVHYMAGFPKHSFNVIHSLIELEFHSEKETEVNGAKIKPLDFTIKTLKNLKTPDGYKETENLWVKIYGRRGKKKKMCEVNCIVKTLSNWSESGSNVGTGRTISIMSQMLIKGMISQKGVFGPEAVIPHAEFLAELGKRKMYVHLNGKQIN